jgi:hypothetical protein
VNFSIVQATNISLVYTIDSYRPIAGEVTLASTGFKCKLPASMRTLSCYGSDIFLAAFGFLLSFYANPWIDEVGYQNAYGFMAGIAAVVLLCWIPLYIWGKSIRHATWKWRVTNYVRWEDDREVGE